MNTNFYNIVLKYGILITGFFVTGGIPSSYANENTISTLIDKIRKTTPQKASYEFGSVKEVTIVPNHNSAIFECNDNPESITEALIGSDGQYLYIYCMLSSGSVTGGGSTLEKSLGSFRQVGGSAAIGLWERAGDKLHLKFQLTNDRKTIVQSYRQLEKRGRFSKSIQSWNLLLGDELELLFPRFTQEQRIEAFTRLWCTVKFNFANFDLVPELKWNDVLHEYLPKVIKDQSNEDYIHLLQECVGRLKDGHTQIDLAGSGNRLACPPVKICSIEGNAIITEVGETSEIKRSGIKRGDEITHVDGQPVRKLLEKQIYPYIPASTVQGRDLKAYPKILQGPPESKIDLTLKKPDGVIYRITLTRKANGWDLLPKVPIKENVEFRDLGNGLIYIAINGFDSDDIVPAFEKKLGSIKNVKGLIIDVRKNGGGNSRFGNAIISHLIEKPIPTTRWKTPQYRAAFQAWGRNEPWYDGGHEMIKPSDTTYRGPLVVLIGPETFSAGEDFVVPLHAAHRAVIVGQRSGGSTGQPLQFSFLDGKISGRVCTKRDQYPDGREFVGVGIIPDVEIHPTVQDIIASRDPVYAKGIQILRERLSSNHD